MTALVTGSFDDTALFPPGGVPMAAAVPAHRRPRVSDLVGPFVVPAARLDELTAHPGDGAPIGVCLTAAAPTGTAADHLRETDAGTLVAALRDWTARVREAFTSFGTCSVLEPVEDLVTLGLLPTTERIPA